MDKKPYQLYRANADFLDGRYAEAAEAYREGTRREDPYAAVNLAYMYRAGLGMPRDNETAVALYKSAYYLDGGVAAFNLALHYMRGLGVPVDLKQALAFMERSAAQGCIDAELYLGLAYLLGCVYDPVHIECIHYIPTYHVVYRDATAALEGATADAALEDARYEVMAPDAARSAEMYANGVKNHDVDEFPQQMGDARFMLGQALIEGAVGTPNARAGFRHLARAALQNGHREAAEYLAGNAELAACYGVDMSRIRYMLDGYAPTKKEQARMALQTPKRRKKQ